jgi:hypothetical protein
MKTEAIERVLQRAGLSSKDARTDEEVAEALNELAAFRESKTFVSKPAALKPNGFHCCGGSDENPQEHTQDCITRTPAPVESP